MYTMYIYVYKQAVSEETVSQGPSDSETADQNSTGESHQTENILHNAICLTWTFISSVTNDLSTIRHRFKHIFIQSLFDHEKW